MITEIFSYSLSDMKHIQQQFKLVSKELSSRANFAAVKANAMNQSYHIFSITQRGSIAIYLLYSTTSHGIL
jgi:hypothetical protein